MQTLHAPRTHPPCKHCMHHTHTAHANVTRTACTLCTANAMQTARTTAHCTHRQRALLLTHIELSAPLLEGVAAAPGLVVLLQHQHTFAHLGQDARSCQTPNAAADDHSIQILRHACGAEPCAWRGEHGAACMHPCSGRRAPSQHAACTRGARNTQQCSMHLSGLRYAPTPCATCSHEVCGVHPCSVRWHSTSTQRALCSPPACSMQPCSVHWCSARCTSTQCAIQTCAACNTHPPSVQYTHMKCAIHTCAACTDAACSTHPCSVQHGPTQHTKCTHPVCNTHLCSMHWPSTPCNPTQRAIHTRAACSSQALCTRVQRVPRSHATCIAPAGNTAGTQHCTGLQGGMDRQTYSHTHTQPPTHPFSAPCHAHAGPSPTAGGVRGVGEQRGSRQSPADAAPAAPAAARPGTEAAAAAAARPTWLQRDGTAARLLHVGDGAVWMQSTSRPPPGRQSGGLGGQSSLSLQQRLTDTAAYGRPARSQQSAPRGAASPSFLPPPQPPHVVLLGHRAACMDGVCVCVCVVRV